MFLQDLHQEPRRYREDKQVALFSNLGNVCYKISELEIYDDIGMYTTCTPFGDQGKSSGQIWEAYSVVALVLNYSMGFNNGRICFRETAFTNLHCD